MSFEKIIFLLFSLFIFSIIIYYLFFDNNNKSNKNPEKENSKIKENLKKENSKIKKENQEKENLNIKKENQEKENLNIKKENSKIKKENLNIKKENSEKIKIDSKSNISILIHYDENKKGVLESTNFDYNSENIALVNAANQNGIGGGGVDFEFNKKGLTVQLEEYRKK